MKKLYIFDFDGTLIDSIEDSMICFNKVLKSFNLPQYKVEDYDKLIYSDFRNFLDSLIDEYDENDTLYNKVIRNFVEVYYHDEKPNTCVYDGIYETLNKLVENNIELAICSNKESFILNDLINKFFSNYNFSIISGSIEGIPDKPNPYRLNKIVEKVDYDKEDILYIGDKDTDIEVAENAGLDIAFVTWGQSNSKDFESDYPLKYVNNPSELLNI
ncbi:hypothetical protein BGI41_05630 [Methanobrevibacter sp. 87.7]|uniref:HAD family hydrolase n=1 Tax=Methanobrevibacter sp. 87.7 TaxID=387957 RepID=UPI000B500220|nr:HAD family hydrolase [Methanobrevibacter sp. 87.7]OWT32822.1 hypothetical protein BGI41_05630 [Methanobrevibacter sp. 87.7]